MSEPGHAWSAETAETAGVDAGAAAESSAPTGSDTATAPASMPPSRPGRASGRRKSGATRTPEGSASTGGGALQRTGDPGPAAAATEAAPPPEFTAPGVRPPSAPSGSGAASSPSEGARTPETEAARAEFHRAAAGSGSAPRARPVGRAAALQAFFVANAGRGLMPSGETSGVLSPNLRTEET